MESVKIDIPVMSDLQASGKKPEYLLWVGCAGAFDDRYKKVVKAFAKILVHLDISFAILGKEESCSGDPARRAGNEMLFQMQALQNIEIFNMYEVKKIITVCPHCYNIFHNEYPDLGGEYEVVNYLQLIGRWIEEGKLLFDKNALNGVKITYHDPCYLARANDIVDEPRTILEELSVEVTEMKRNRQRALCCGAGGAQMFKEAEKGSGEIFMERTNEAIATGASVIATACPFCMTMITDGIKYNNKESEVKNLDIAELIVQSLDL